MSRGVAVFGSSEPQEGEALYEQARQVGSLLAARGFTVVNGGYGGVMEAASRGAREAGGEALGVTAEIFSSRGGGNEYLSREIVEPDLFLRTRTLVEQSGGFVVLAGKSGTLAELSFLWALHRAGQLGGRPVVLLGEIWPGLVATLRDSGILEPAQEQITLFAATPAESVELVARHLPAGRTLSTGEHS